MSLTPVKSYSFKVFRGDNWELTFEESKGIDADDYSSQIGEKALYLRLQWGQDENSYQVKLVLDGKVFETKKPIAEDFYKLIFDGITQGKMTIDEIRNVLELTVDLTR
jgi:hypothetical protein